MLLSRWMVKFTESCVTLAYDPQNPSNGQTFISLNMTLSRSNIHENNADNHQKSWQNQWGKTVPRPYWYQSHRIVPYFAVNSLFSLGLLPLGLVPAVRPSSEGVSFCELIAVLLWWPLLLEWVNLLKWDCCLTLSSGIATFTSVCWWDNAAEFVLIIFSS